MPPQDGDVQESRQSVDNLLDEIPTERNLRQIYRLANLIRDDEFLAELGLDGLVVPSARRENGSNQPVFRRRAISDPKSQGLVKITFDPQTGEIATASTGD